MVARKNRKTKLVVTTEDAFGTPPAARSGMMTVAGATDSDDDVGNKDILNDDEHHKFESRTLVTTLGKLRYFVRQHVI